MQLEKTNHTGPAVMWSHKLGTYMAHMGFTHHKAPREHTRKAALFYVHKYIRKFVGVLDITQGSFHISTSHHHTWPAKDKLLYYFCTAPWQVIFTYGRQRINSCTITVQHLDLICTNYIMWKMLKFSKTYFSPRANFGEGK
jgi:hypothetical protein